MASLRIAVLFVAIFLIAQSNADQCSIGCQGVNPPKGGFLEGQTYSYTIDGVSTINLSGANDQDVNLKLSAQATVYGLGNCANLLKITSLTITEQDGTKHPKPSDIELPVRFTLQDGVLGSDICSEKGDSQKSLNIKRAIISLLQTATKNTHEVDVFGICPTTFLVSNEGGGQIIHKTRNLNSCAYREQAKQDLLTYVSNPGSEIKNSNILKSDLRSDVAVKNGIVEKVEVNEDYLYRPFSVGNHGVKGFVNTKLVLKGTNKGTIAAQCTVPKSIIFENPHLVNTDHSNVVNILNTLKTATDSMKDHVQVTSASKFVTLVRALRVSSKDDLKSVYGQIQSGSQIKDNNLAKRVFLDALFRTGTGDSIEFSVELLQSKKLSHFEERLVLASLSNVRHASSNSLKAAISLLDNEDLPLDVYLGVGALAGAYCREHQCHGATSQDAGVKALSDKFAAKLGNCKTGGSRKAEDLQLAVLKGIRNIGHIEDSLVDKLAHCASDKSVKPRIRVGAIEAFHADPCISKLKQTAISILKDTQQDSEIRIKAYLALVDCPCNLVAKEVSALLENEPVYQVGSFITSSLNNIRASTNPNKKNAKYFLGSIHPRKNYPLNIGKFSQNYELSYEMNSAGIGSAVEGNVIFSQDSYLPRSVNLNLTTEIFGRQINLFELGVRQGNLDRFIEQYFGPQSELNTDTPQQLYSSFKKHIDTIIEKISERTKKYKTKRDVQKQIAALGKKLSTNIQGFNGNLDLDVVVKLFGVESVFLSLGDDRPDLIESFIDKAFNYLDSGVDAAKNFAHNVHNNLIFLDMELSYPTSTGITMKLNLEGGLTSKVTVGSNVDFKRLIQDPKNSKVELKIIPSANVDIIGSLSFDADSVVKGLKTVMSLQTSTGSHIVFKTANNGFDMQIGLPVEKQELLTASSNIFFFKREKGAQDVDQKAKFDHQNWSPFATGCFDQLASTIGLTLCADVSIPKSWDIEKSNTKLLEQPLFPLNGNALISVRLEKENLNAYHIKGNHVSKDGITTTDLDIIVEGLKKPNKIGLKFETAATPKLHSILAKLDSSDVKLEGYVGLKTSEEEYSFDTRVLWQDLIYSLKFGVVKPDQNTYKPLLDYRTGSNDKPITVDGVINVEKSGNQRKYVFKGVSLIMAKEKFAVNGYVSHAPNPFLWDMDLKFSNQDKYGAFKGKLEHGKEYTKGFLEVHNSLNAVADFKVDLDSICKPTEKKLVISAAHGKDLQSATNKISLNSHYKESAPGLYTFKNKLTYPAEEFSAKMDINVEAKVIEFELEGEYQKKKADFEVIFKNKKLGSFYGKGKAEVANKGIELEVEIDEETKDKHKFSTKVQMKPQGKYEMSGTVIYRNEPNNEEYGLVATYKHAGKPDAYNIDVGGTLNPSGYKFHDKVSVGSVVYADILLDVKRPANSGNLKIILKDAINAQGQFKVNPDNKGNGLLIVDFTKWDRKVKLESNFIFFDPTYNFNLDFYPNSGKDNNKLTFSTQNTVKEGNYDSKNSLTINGERHEVNLKCDRSGKFENGHDNGHLDITLHGGKSLSITVARQATTKNEITEASMDFNSVYTSTKGASPCKASWKAKLNKMDRTTKAIDAEHHINIVSSNGKDLDLKLAIKRNPKNERAQADIKFDASGSILNDRANVFMTFDYYDGPDDYKEDVTYRIKGTYGDKASLEYSGVLSMEAEDNKNSQFKNDFDLHVLFPTEKPFEIKVNSKDLFFVPVADEKYFEFTTSKAAQINGNWYKYDGLAKFNRGSGNVKVSAQIPNHNKVGFESNYKHEDLEDDSVKCWNSISLDYGENKHFKVVIDSHRTPGKEGQLNVAADLPEGLNVKKVVSNVNYKTPADKSVTGDLKVDIDGKKYALSTNINLVDKHDSTVEVKASYPDGKPARVFIHTIKPAEHQYKAESKFENLGDFNMDLNVDATVQSPVFNVKIYANSEKLKLNKVNFEATADIVNDKKVKFSATEDGKNILSGETTIQSREEGYKYIIDGSGKVKIRNDEKTTSFKYIKNQIREKTEQGHEIFLNVGLDEKKVVIEHKFSNKEYKLSTLYCEANSQCANIDIKNKIDTSPTKSIHNMEFIFNLRKLGLASEFGLRSSTEFERFKLPILSLDIHMDRDKFKYHVQAYAKPDPKKNKAYVSALILTTPNRDIVLESTTSLPESAKSIFPLQHETVFFFNRNDPNTKTLFRISQNVEKEEHKYASSSSQILFTSPALGKDLEISTKSHYDTKTHEVTYEVVLDIFKKKNQKITGSLKFHPEVLRDSDIFKSKILYTLSVHINAKAFGYEVTGNEKFSLSSEGLQLESVVKSVIDKATKEMSLKLNANSHEQSFNLKVPQGELIDYNCKCHHGDGNHKMQATLTLLQEKTYTSETEITWSPKYEFLVKINAKNQPGELKVYGNANPKKAVEFGIKHANEDLVFFHAGFEGKPKYDWKFNNKGMKPVAEKIKENVDALIAKASKTIAAYNEEARKEAKRLTELSKTASPDFKNYIKSYEQELEKLTTELKADKYLNAFGESVYKLFGSISKVVIEITEKYLAIVGKTNEALMDTLNKLVEVWTSKILPELTTLTEKASQAFLQVAAAVFDVFSHYVAYVSDFVDKHSAEFKPIFEDIAKIIENAWQTLDENFVGVRQQLAAIFEAAKEQLEEFPLIQMINEKIEDYDIPQTFLQIVKYITDRIKEITTTKEVKIFLDSFVSYVEKKVNKEKIDDIQQLSIIYKNAINAYDKLVVTDDFTLPQISVPDYSFVSVTNNFSTWESKFPSVTPPEFSVINHIINRNFPDPVELIRAYFPRNIFVEDLLPPFDLQAIVAGGQHIFTYDGRHMTFPGSCKYVLSQDAVDGNFSIVLNLDKGAPKSIIFWDKSAETVEVNSHDLLVDGKKHGFPLIKSNIRAYKQGDSFSIESSYGVHIRCSRSLDLCYFKISGFYFGKLRGLLGDGNNEPFDDFRLPGGKISTSIPEFTGAYGLTHCQAPALLDHTFHDHGEKHAESPMCAEAFGKTSPLRYGYLAVDIQNYKQACEHAVAKNGPKVKDEVCLIAKAYQLACRKSNLLFELPNMCSQCVLDGKTYEPEQEVPFKLPLKQADIVISVETTKTNEKTFKELTIPLVSAIIDEYKSKKIDDIKVMLVGMSPKSDKPYEYDIENNKLKGNKMSFTDEERSMPWQSPVTLENTQYDKVLDNLAHHVQLFLRELGFANLEISYTRLGASVNWRPKALKSLIVFHSEPFVINPFLQAFNDLRDQLLVKSFGIVSHVFTPLESLQSKGVKDNTIIGFNRNDVFVLDDKKRGKSHSNLRSGIQYDSDNSIHRVLGVDGNAYSTKSFFALEPADRKKYITLASQTIVDSLVDVEQEVVCKCKNVFFMAPGRFHCKVVNRKNKVSKK